VRMKRTCILTEWGEAKLNKTKASPTATALQTKQN
jgi:hypothetical protein